MINKDKFILIILSSIILSCSYKNHFEQNRVNFNIERIKPNSDEKVYTIIDTSKIYKEVFLTDNLRKPINLPYRGKTIYLKFYKNGRVAQFNGMDLTIDSLNPKRARSCLYSFKKNVFIIQVYFTNPQCGQCFIKQKLNKISDDTFELESDGYISTFKAQNIPQSSLIYKPDW